MTMCYGNPSKSLAIARERMTAEQWADFEREFEDFCVTSGLEGWLLHGEWFAWVQWAYLSARPVVERYSEDRRVRNAYFEKVAIASMTDEQAQMSLERWKGETK